MKKTSPQSGRIATLFLTLGLVFGLNGCKEPGPFEKAGESIDEAGRTIKNGGEKTTGDKLDDAADNIRKDVNKAADDLKK